MIEDPTFLETRIDSTVTERELRHTLENWDGVNPKRYVVFAINHHHYRDWCGELRIPLCRARYISSPYQLRGINPLDVVVVRLPDWEENEAYRDPEIRHFLHRACENLYY